MYGLAGNSRAGRQWDLSAAADGYLLGYRNKQINCAVKKAIDCRLPEVCIPSAMRYNIKPKSADFLQCYGKTFSDYFAILMEYRTYLRYTADTINPLSFVTDFDLLFNGIDLAQFNRPVITAFHLAAHPGIVRMYTRVNEIHITFPYASENRICVLIQKSNTDNIAYAQQFGTNDVVWSRTAVKLFKTCLKYSKAKSYADAAGKIYTFCNSLFSRGLVQSVKGRDLMYKIDLVKPHNQYPITEFNTYRKGYGSIVFKMIDNSIIIGLPFNTHFHEIAGGLKELIRLLDN